MFKRTPNSATIASQISVKKPQLDPAFIPVLPYQELLKSEKHQELLKNIRALVSLPTTDYELFYFKSIVNFSEFVQQLPETSHSYYSHRGGLLDHGLERAHMALSLCRSYLLPDQANVQQLSPIHELWLYAIFTAALLLDVGKIATKEIITLYDNQGNKLKLWQPSTGSMLAQAPYYQYDYTKENLDRLKNFITPILARQILSAEVSLNNEPNGFDWIASNNEILEAWLAILNGDHTGGSFILTVIPIAEAQTIANYFTENNKLLQNTANSKVFPEKNKPSEYLADTANNQAKPKSLSDDISASTSIFQPAQQPGAGVATAATNVFTGGVASSIAPTVTAGIAFINWLQNSIAQNRWSINAVDSPLQRVAEGLWLDHSRLIQEFCRENPAQGTAKTVMAQFIALDIALNGGKLQSYFSTKTSTERVHQGLLVNTHLFIKEAALAGIPVNENFIKIPGTPPNPTVAPIAGSVAAIKAANKMPGSTT